ncbi:Spx/MgsR family RNA polymerase-binding regulatory protein [Pseudomarimonas arenosa]|uniref:Spx/MgsR family RNA polymerase-binding regulatory protein n=1 Tax=Pseudomarimonas arenosa TaxID=2774145 RepID=A0AAW3ZRH5_9GAMM|nr:Spx/MgsR family RNA polymerase-binding regulatory protein [Pseudomarimonas arenosa]MBD8527152.1 Spx/MgsR family RNA polymerase-binding regulatory protein [Pseudomarimonas arenosa]
MSLTLYGLNKCDTCQKARNWLNRNTIEHSFVDYREHPVAAATLKEWAAQLGGFEKLVNRASMTWRGLPESRKSPGTAAEWTLLIKEYPALVKRPVAVDASGAVAVGFSDKAYKLRFSLRS